MSAQPDVMDLVAALKGKGEAFCLATVVRTVSVTAAKAGAKAVIRADGSIAEGWIGGGCARAAVLRAAQDALADGRPRLVSVMPKDLLAERGVLAGDERQGVRFARNACPSQGTMDVFVEPMLPRPEIVIIGASPVAVALASLAPRFGYMVTICAAAEEQAAFAAADRRVIGYAPPGEGLGRRFVVISTQGRGDEAALAAALAPPAEYVGFVGSRRKLAALRASLAARHGSGLPLDAVKGPAGIDIGAISPEEIALSILAEIIARRRQGQRLEAATTPDERTPMP